MDDDNQYGMMDLTQYLNGRPLFSSVSPNLTPDLLCSNQHFDMLMTSTTTTTTTTHVPQHEDYFPRHHHYHYHHGFHPESSTVVAGSTVSGGCALSAMETEGGNGRWPRQETLKLLEVRSQLDSKFKEAIQKGPLWDEVSRIMSEEYGYQRSGKKCREKFENLYKYYKKTKDGKAGRQDGKHYRYFRQLEALYGKTSNTINTNTFHQYQVHYNQQPHHCPKVSDDNLYDSSDSDDSDNSSNDDSKRKNSKKKGKRSWKGMISDFMDIQMRKLMEKQDIWLEKMMKTIEDKEKERILREEEWRKKEEIRLEKQQKFWADERAWIEERDAVLIDTLRRLNGEKIVMNSTINYNDEYGSTSYCNKKQKEMNSLSSYCETSRHVPNIHDTMDDGYIARIL